MTMLWMTPKDTEYWFYLNRNTQRLIDGIRVGRKLTCLSAWLRFELASAKSSQTPEYCVYM